MKKLVIENKTELLCLQEILEEHPKLLLSAGLELSAISNVFRKETLEKIKQILSDTQADSEESVS